MNKVFIKLLLVCAVVAIPQIAKATDQTVYVKALLDPPSALKIHMVVNDALLTLPEKEPKFSKVIWQSDLHMTINPVASEFRPRELADITNVAARAHRDVFHTRCDEIAKALSGVQFTITGISSNYGRDSGTKRFAVLEISPQLQQLSASQKRILQEVLQNKSHISLVVAGTNESYQLQNLVVFHKRINEWIENASKTEKQIVFGKVMAGYQTGPDSELCIYSAQFKENRPGAKQVGQQQRGQTQALSVRS